MELRNDQLDGEVESGLLAIEPCEGHVAADQRTELWRGRTVRVSECQDEEGRYLGEHTFSPEVGVVVRTESPEGMIAELHGIERVSLAAVHFAPRTDYRSVDLDEFMNGRADLGSY